MVVVVHVGSVKKVSNVPSREPVVVSLYVQIRSVATMVVEVVVASVVWVLFVTNQDNVVVCFNVRISCVVTMVVVVVVGNVLVVGWKICWRFVLSPRVSRLYVVLVAKAKRVETMVVVEVVVPVPKVRCVMLRFNVSR